MPLKEKQFVVEGGGSFPLDMLRYDRAYPVGPSDVDGLTWDMDKGANRRQVRLGTAASRISADRWASFGWTVIEQGVGRG